MERNFTDILLEFLKSENMKQKDFANIIGVKPSQVSEWIHGKSKPGYDILKKMALALNISADYFLGLIETY